MATIHRVSDSPYWHCFFYLPDGRRTHRSTGTRDKRKALPVCLKMAEASELAREARLTETRARETVADIYAIANREAMPSATVRAYLAGWLDRKRLEVTEGSAGEYERVAGELMDSLGEKADKPIDAVTVRDAATYRDKLAKRVTGATVNKALKIVRGAWSRALRDGLLHENVFARLDLVKASRTDRRAFTLDEVKRILAACGPEWRGLVLFGFYTGQRLGDIARLTWQNVDLSTQEIRLITRKTGRTMILPMPSPLMRYAITLPASDNPAAPLFPTAAGAAISTLSRQFAELLASIGLTCGQKVRPGTGTVSHDRRGKGRDSRRTTGGLSFHCLRHTTTSALKNAGVNNAVTMELIGHESEAVSRTYTHIEARALKNAVNRLPNLVPETALKRKA
ncbi:MAG: hypothetical protein A2283_12395 [Lentisphaerae bacterium RIFOXYA12_FULL_48_11]|nr:MAG: hypothetical protein A2283_12395 [Lentisphaerae bacterium RIFOXYA12_FULL_48_11]